MLLVEDSEHDAFFFQQAMQKADVSFPLRVVTDGLQAVDYLTGAPPYSDRNQFPLPRLVLLDLKIPKKSGFEVLEWIRAEPPLRDLPVLILTSSSERPDIFRAYDLGVILYITKPIGMTSLRALVRALAAYWEDLEHGPQPDLVSFAMRRPG
jgi:CheY-like chemotaxis protein